MGGTIAGGSDLTVEAGAEILEKGGNATDAAVAAALASFHAEPLLASAAGGGMILAGSREGGFSVLDFVPAVPGLGLESRPPLEFEAVEIDFGVTTQTFHVGTGSAAVPSALLGLAEAHRMWGELPLRDVVAPAVRLCREGFVLSPTTANFIRILEPIWRRSRDAAVLYTTDGVKRSGTGDLLQNVDFAVVLETLATEGTGPFYTGAIARQTVDAFGPDAGGLLTPEDLVAYAPSVLAPLEVPVLGGVFLTPPPPSTGGSLIALTLALLARHGVDHDAFLGAGHIEPLVDAQLLALALRWERLGSGRFTPDDVYALLSRPELSRALERFGRVTPGKIGRDVPGHGSTTHVSVLDDRGGAAAVTVSNGEGCGHVIPGTGMHMNNFLGEEDINPTGFHAEPPGTRLTSMMAPSIFVREGRPVLVLGSGGSNRLRSAILQVAVNRLVYGRSIEGSVRAPRVHVEEADFYAETVDADGEMLESLGERFPRRHLFPGRSLYFGGVHAVAREPDGRLVGTGDPRRAGASRTVRA